MFEEKRNSERVGKRGHKSLHRFAVTAGTLNSKYTFTYALRIYIFLLLECK